MSATEAAADLRARADLWIRLGPIGNIDSLLHEARDARGWEQVRGLFAGPAAALQVFGSAADVWARMGEIAKAARRDGAFPRTGPAQDELLRAQNRRYVELRHLLPGLARAEEVIAAFGWRYDPKTRDLVAITETSGWGRPRRLLTKCIVLHFADIHQRELFPPGSGNTAEVREEIRNRLIACFPSEMLDTQSGGSISQAIKNHLKKTK